MTKFYAVRNLLLVVMLGMIGGKGWGQTPNGFLDFGTTASGAATISNTGFNAVTVGSGGGGFTIQNPGQPIGTNAEVRGIAPTSGSINSVDVTSTGYGTASSTFTISFEVYFSGGSSGEWYFFAGNGTPYGTVNSFSGASTFAGLQWIYGASGAITTNNRNNATWNTTGITGTPFSQGIGYYVTIVGNNSASAVTYGASGVYSVAANKYDLWVNGALVGDDLAKAQQAASATINAFRFYGISSTSNVAQIAIDNIRWYNTCVLPPTHLALVGVPSTGTVSTNLAPYTAEARSGSASGPVANSFTGPITVAKATGSGGISGTLAPNALAGVATYNNTQFDAASTYTIVASAGSPIVSSAASGNIVVTASSNTPTQLVITSISPSSPVAGSTFDVTVQAVDGGNIASNVSANTAFTLTTNGNAGTIGGTTTGTISSGSSSVTVTGVTLSSSGTGANLTATQTSGSNVLSFGTSSNFTVLATVPSVASSVVATNKAATTMDISWASGGGSRRIVVARLNATTAVAPTAGTTYTPTTTGSFTGNPTTGTGNVVLYNGAGSSVSITNLTAATAYAFDVYEYNGTTSTANYSAAATSGSVSTLATPPSAQASNITFGAFLSNGTGYTIGFTAGTGGTGRIVVVRQGSAVDFVPVAGTTYTANADFSIGAGVGPSADNKVVYASNGSSVAVTGLTANTVYHVAVYEYNGSGATINFLTASPAIGNRNTLVAEPTTQPTGFTRTTVSTTGMTIGWTAAAAPGANGYIVLRTTTSGAIYPSTAPVDGTTYSAGNTIGNATVEYIGSGQTSSISSLLPQSQYSFSIYSFNGSGAVINYNIASPLQGQPYTLATEPADQPVTYSVSAVTSNGATVAINGVTNGVGVAVFLKPSTSVDYVPLDGVSLSSDVNASFGSGTQFGSGNYLVYLLATPQPFSVNITNLSPGVTYSIATYVYNGLNSQSSNNFNPTPVAGTFSTLAAEPTAAPGTATVSNISSTNMDVSWLAASPAPTGGYIVLRRQGGAPGVPVDGTTYTVGDVITTTSTVAYIGSSLTTAQSSLSPGSSYSYRIFTYNGSGASINYYTSSSSSITGFTYSTEPTAHAASFTATVTSATNINLAFPAASTLPASGFLILKKSSAFVSGDYPVDGNAYSVSAPVGANGATVNSIITNNSTTTSTGTNVTADNTYYYLLVPFNWDGTNSATRNYYTSPTIPTANATTPSAGSDVTAVTNSEAATISSLTNDAAPLSSTQGTQVWQVTVRDGGTALNDGDALPTKVTGLVLTQNASSSVLSWSNSIKTVALFDGSIFLATGTVGVPAANNITFTGFTTTVADGSSKTLTIRLSLSNTLGATDDNKKFVFNLTNSNVITPNDGTSSGFSSFTAFNSSTSSNAIAVVATKLAFVQGPTDVNKGAAMTPAVTVKAADANGNQDLDYVTSVNVVTSQNPSSLGGTTTVIPVAGLATFSNLIHSTAGTGYTLTATSGSFSGVGSGPITYSVINAAVPIAGWDFSNLNNGTNNFGPSPYTATTANSNTTVGGLTRGSGVSTTGTGSSSAWGGTGWDGPTDQATAIAANKFATFSITANAGFTTSLSSISAYNIRRSGSGPTTGQWQYQVGAGTFVNIGSAITWGTTTSATGNPQSAITLSGITALQNVVAGTTITFRIVTWGATTSGGTWYINDPIGSTPDDLVLNGFVDCATPLNKTVNAQVPGICMGTSTNIIVSSSETGVNYQLRNNSDNSLIGSSVAGTGSSINLPTGNLAATTTFNVLASNAIGGCSSAVLQMGNTPTVTVNPSPNTYTVSSTGSHCFGQGGLTIGLDNSQTGVNYQLKLNGTNTGSPVAGTGSAISFGVQTAEGTYTVVANNTSTACTQTMSGFQTINPSPDAPTVTVTQPSSCGTATGTITVTAPTGFDYSVDGGPYQSGTTFSGVAIGNHTVTAKNTSAAGCISPATVVTINAPANYWVGGTGTNWNNPANWSCGIVPSATQNAFISASAPTQPILEADITIADLSIETGAKITLNDKTFTINGNATGAGVLVGSATSNLVVGGTGGTGVINFDPTTNDVSNALQNLTINRPNGNIGIGSTLNLLSVLTVTDGTLNPNGKLVLRSSGIQTTARVAPVGTNGHISGDVVSERFIPATARAYRFISPSVTTGTSIRQNWMENQNNPSTTQNLNSKPGYGTHITGNAGDAGGFDVTQNNSPSLFGYNNSTEVWSTVTSTSGNLTAGVPLRLFVRGDRGISLASNTPTPTNTILRATGALRTGTIVYNSTSTPAIIYRGNALSYDFVGNPYASPVDWNQLAKNNLGPTYWCWDPHIGGKGVYVSYNGANGHTNFDQDSKVNSNLQPGQAFFVEVKGSSPSLEFEETDKTSVFTAVFRTPGSEPVISANLFYNDTSGTRILADGVTAIFDDSFSKWVSDEDSYKFTNNDENLCINHEDTMLSIEGRPISGATDTLKLKLWQYRQKSYVFKVNVKNFPAGTTAVMKDAYLNNETLLSITDSTLVPFSLTTDSASFAPDRFIIVFKPGSVLPVTVTDVKAYQKEKGIQVDWISRTETNISRYEVEKSLNGRDFAKAGSVETTGNNTAVTSYGWFDATPAEGNNFYRVKVIEKSGAVKYTQIVKVTIGKANSSMTVYPNPVKGSTISLHMTNMEKGKYTATLYNNLGQKMLSKQIEHIGGSANYSMSTGKVMPKGTYRLTATNGETEMTATVVFE